MSRFFRFLQEQTSNHIRGVLITIFCLTIYTVITTITVVYLYTEKDSPDEAVIELEGKLESCLNAEYKKQLTKLQK